jgi:hypothetical protein
MQITITVDDETGQMTVEADGQEPYMCESAEDCLEYVEGLLSGGEMDAETMWNEEAAKRPPEPMPMA